MHAKTRLLARLAIVGVVGAAAGFQVPAAVAQGPLGDLVAYDYRVEISGPTTVCIDQEYEYRISVEKYAVYQNGSQRTFVSGGSVPAQISLTVSGTTSTGQSITGGSTFFRGASFPVRFAAAGRYTLTARGTGVPIVPGSGIQATVDPATIQVEAQVCELEITVISIWYHLPDGFNPWVGAVINELPMTIDGTGHFRATSPIETFAMPASKGGCSATFTTQGVELTADAVVRRSGLLRFELDYTYGTAVARANCAGFVSESPPARMAIRSAEFFVDQPDTTTATVARIFPHIADIQSLGQYAVNGLTYVIVSLH